MTSQPKYDGPGYYEVAQWDSPSLIAYVRPCVYKRAGYPDEPGLELLASKDHEIGLQLRRRSIERHIVRKVTPDGDTAVTRPARPCDTE